MKRKIFKGLLASAMLCGALTLSGCTSTNDQVVIYSNADDEAVEAMKKTLDNNGYEGKYLFQTFGTSELGGKLLAEGKDIEADLVTMSSFYLDSAQDKKNMFVNLDFETKSLEQYSSYYTPITSQEGAIIVNAEELKANNLATPTCLKDLAKPEYKDMISVTDISSSSTAWLLIQALVSEYGEDGAKDVLKGIYKNAGAHIEDSGSGPIKKVRAGEVAIGFGLRHQAVRDKEDGLPIDYIDPIEGNFSLTESVAIVNKDNNEHQKLAMEMAKCIIEKGRKELLKTYPNPLYEGELSDVVNKSAYPKVFDNKLTVDLLEKHQKLSEECK
ncbi:MAG: extracellular solute-binding protein [Thomasclavelia sp.]|uniref:extracellular solute-binding protein n=1 Tax=Thomasclavelia sp. TaxID=3025757 RepID=UPI0039A1C693